MKVSSIGGQGVLEGVMMKAPETSALAVRKESGEIVTKVWKNKKVSHNNFDLACDTRRRELRADDGAGRRYDH